MLLNLEPADPMRQGGGGGGGAVDNEGPFSEHLTWHIPEHAKAPPRCHDFPKHAWCCKAMAGDMENVPASDGSTCFSLPTVY